MFLLRPRERRYCTLQAITEVNKYIKNVQLEQLDMGFSNMFTLIVFIAFVRLKSALCLKMPPYSSFLL